MLSVKTSDEKVCQLTLLDHVMRFLDSFSHIYWACYVEGNIIGTRDDEVNKKVLDSNFSTVW